MKIACIQPIIAETMNECFSQVELLLKKLLLKFDDCEIVCLPEKWIPICNDLSLNFQEERGVQYNFLKDIAKKYNINIISGGIWEKRSYLKKPIITCYYFNKKGEEIGRQDKMHLYSYEKKHFISGNELKIFPLNKHHFSILICFDMAFFETPRLAVENGADLLISPTQIREDGMENWKIYLQARVLENRVPAAACNTCGKIFDRIFMGNSKIISFINGYISPSKLKVKEAPLGESCFVFENIDLEFPKKLRKIRLSEKINKSDIIVKKV